MTKKTIEDGEAIIESERPGIGCAYWDDENADEEDGDPWANFEETCELFFGLTSEEVDDDDPDWYPSFMND